MRTYGLSMEEAGRAKKEGGLPSNYQPEVLDPFIDDMTQQVSRSFQFYLASGSGRSQPDQILICGGCANNHEQRQRERPQDALPIALVCKRESRPRWSTWFLPT